MANPSPQHVPTDGLGSAAKLVVTSNDANFQTVVANREYAQQLSKSGATINGTAYASTATLSGAVKDAGGSAFASGNSNAVSFASNNTYVATVNASSGAITCVNHGVAVIDVKFPTFDGTDGVDFIYAQVVVTVYP